MGEGNRDRTWAWAIDGPAAESPDAWLVDRARLWAWVDDLLEGLPVDELDAASLRALCAQALDTHAPAALVHAQAAGVLLEHLVAVAIAHAYADRYAGGDGHPHPDGLYEVGRVRAVVRALCRAAALPA